MPNHVQFHSSMAFITEIGRKDKNKLTFCGSEFQTQKITRTMIYISFKTLLKKE